MGSDLRKPEGVGHVYAFERSTGKPRWKYPVKFGVAADLARIGPNVFAVTLEDEVLCLDWKTGELVWKSATGQPNDEFLLNSTPAASGDRIFFGGLDGTIHAMDADSGAVVWKRVLGGRITTSLLLSAGSLYAGNSNGHIYRLNAGTGTVIADHALEETPTGRLVLAEGSLLLFLGDKEVACLDSSLKGVRWRRKASEAWSSSRPYAWNHAVLVGSQDGELFAIRATDGTLLWSDRFDGVIRGIGQSKDLLYVGTLKGRVYAYRPDTR